MIHKLNAPAYSIGVFMWVVVKY